MGALKSLALIGVALALPAQAAEKSLPADGLKSVSVESLSGDVTVRGAAQKTVRVTWDESEGPAELTVEGDLLRVTGADRSKLRTDVTIELPQDLRLSVSSVSGDVKVEGLTERIKLVSVSGDVRLRALGGGAEIKSVSGEVLIDDLSGDLSIKSVSGDVRADKVNAPLSEIKTVSGSIKLIPTGPIQRARLATHSGDVELRGALAPDADIKAKSFSGDLTLRFPEGTAFDLEAASRSGSVQIDHKIQTEERSENRVRGRAGNGGAALELETFSGDIRVLR